MSAVRTLLDDLSAGKIPLEQVAYDFRTRDWPVPPVTDRSYWETESDPDPPPHLPPGFPEVSAAFSRGDINRAQYTALARAAGDRIREQLGGTG